MMFLVKILLIYIIIINIYFFSKTKRELMGFDHWGDFLKSIFIVLSFLVFFVFFIKLLNLFRESKSLDLKIFLHNFDSSFLILCFVCLYLIRKNIMFVVKLNFIKLHYFGMISYLPQNPYSKYYTKFYTNFIYKISRFFFIKTYWLDKILTLLILCLIVKDILLNDMVLDSCLEFAPWYSVYKLCFICARFISMKQNSFLDYYLYCICYAWTGFISSDAEFYKGSTESWRMICMKVSQYEEEVIKV